MTDPTPVRILIAIPTLDRPDDLARALRALARMRVPDGATAHVVVFDNGGGRTAGPVVRAAQAAGHPLRIDCRAVPERGLAHVRNAALRTALDEGADLLACLDDDTRPGRGWLAAHLDALRRTGAPASIGPVRPVYDRPPPRWMARAGVHALAVPRTGPPPVAHTANAVIRLAPVRAADLRFDPSFNLTGGEDTDFFARLAVAAGPLAAAPAAPVWERVPDGRATLRWLLRRWRRTGQTSARLRRVSGLSASGCAGRGAARLAAGAVLAATGRWPAGLRLAARGAGFIDAAFGRVTQEYER